jgi:NAD(P)-dependent dehydrogenase (short-subunit alcohol dehydrogenase family)
VNELPWVVRDPRSLFEVRDRSIMITGATGAFGQVAALSLAAAGARIPLAARNTARGSSGSAME